MQQSEDTGNYSPGAYPSLLKSNVARIPLLDETRLKTKSGIAIAISSFC